MEKMTKCECGSTEFYIKETLWHKAEIGDDGILIAYKDTDNGIDLVMCEKCNKEYTEEEFISIQF